MFQSKHRKMSFRFYKYQHSERSEDSKLTKQRTILNLIKRFSNIKQIRVMHNSFSLQLFVLFSLMLDVCGNKYEKQLFRDLFREYNKNVRPVLELNETVYVEIRHTISRIIEVEEREEIFITSGWSSLRWTDAYLSWDPEKYGGLKTINCSPDFVWIPDIVLYDDFQTEKSFGSHVDQIQNRLSINHTGAIVWALKTIFKTKCHMEIYYYPFDSQKCPFRYGSWSHGVGRIEILPSSHIKIDPHAKPYGWALLNYTTTLIKKDYAEEVYHYVEFTVTFHRLAFLTAVNLILPPIVIGTLVLHAFVLPAASGERLALAITLLLAMIFFIINMGYLMPSDSLVLPLLYRFFLSTVGQIVLQIIALIFGMQLYHKKAHEPPMPQWVREFILDKIAYLLGTRTVDDISDINSLSSTEMETIIEFGYVPNLSSKMLIINGPYGVSSKFDPHKEDAITLKEWSIVALTVDRCLYVFFLSMWLITIMVFFMMVTAEHQIVED